MKFMAIGYFDRAAMDALTPAELDATLSQCGPAMQALYATGQVRLDVGLATQGKGVCTRGGTLRVTDGPFAEAKEVIGSALLIEADTLEDAMRVAALHPAAALAAGERLGWRLEVRPVHYFSDGPQG